MISSAFMAVASAGMAYGIGDVFRATGNIAAALGKTGTEIARALAHGITGGFMSVINGGSFASGFLSGAFASIGGHFANKYLGGSFGAQAASGIILGGLGSVLVGGNFWMGAAQGLIVTVFNHLKHIIDVPKPKSNRKANYKTPRKSQENDWLSPTNTTIGGAGVFGTGFENLSGRTTIGMNFKLYPSGWRGNQYVSTFRITKVGKVLGTATFVIGTALDTYGVYNYYTEGANSPNAVHPIKGSANLGVGLWGMLHPVTAFGATLYYGIDTFDPRGFSGAMEAVGNTEIQHRKMTGTGLLNGPKF
ncbi:hypothetical protein HZP94_15030 [Elizabethkingia anophelis]|uniref:hypothetical protein n=1 Tax=Elizabethkingia anophelis TaxID=1117645 RepID=UPI0021A7607B|nr:hypothetical protein [Elizabethkingia anophelis]MCT4063675.1 hypothetical protein [Elizabethkingia anophelis]MCT4109975.1 hypothetical protein [Elizabethkingia anophelis]